MIHYLLLFLFSALKYKQPEEKQWQNVNKQEN